MISEGYLQESPVLNGFGSTVDLSKEGMRWLAKATRFDNCTMMLAANHELLTLDQSSRPELTLSARFIMTVCVNEMQPCL